MSKNNGLPKGITIRKHNQSEVIQIFFMYRNVRCREIIPLPPTKDNIRRAELKRNVILAEIEAKTFKYAEHFPDSTKLKLFFTARKKATMGELIEEYYDSYKKMNERGHIALSTVKLYRRTANLLLKYFKDIYIHNLEPQHIKNYIELLGADNLTTKTINDRLKFLKAVIKEAIFNGLIAESPFERVNTVKELNKFGSKSSYTVEPFNTAEKEQILNSLSGQFKNTIQFNFWAGLRISELIALKWEDINFETGIIHIQRAKVERELKGTKTKAGKRKIVLLPKAREALLAQLEFTKGCEFVFNSPYTNKPWGHSNVFGDYWRRALKRLDIKYRNAYQMRHTYASTLLSNGENVFWLATQMGHETPDMIFEHYGRYIPEGKNGYNFVGNYN